MAPTSPAADIAVHDLGGDGPPLLISHATGFHGLVYRPMAEALADRFHSIAFDYRGHGDTPSPSGWDVDWQGYGDDIVAVAASLEHPLVVFGHSMGGATALMAAKRHPDWFSHLVLFEPVVFPPIGFDAPAGQSSLATGTRKRKATFPSAEAAYANYASKPPMNAFTPEALHLYVDHGFKADPDGVRLKCDPEHEAATFEMGARHDTWDILAGIELPVTIIGGRLDGTGPAAVAEQVAQQLPDGRYVYVDEFDHFAPMSDPAAMAKLIVDAAG
jgi:pimeloyl-ACP methyl ester carboxylesterase